MSKLSRVGVVGPLAPHAPGFRRDLAGRGYSPHTAADLLYLLAHLSRWLDEHGLDGRDLTGVWVDRFLCDRRAAGYVHHLTPRALGPLLGYLRRIGVLPEPAGLIIVPGPVDALVAEFAAFLVDARGLAVRTVDKYTAIAGRFFAWRAAWSHTAGELALAELSAGEFDAFILGESARLGARSLRGVVTGLRALLRFLVVRGVIAPGLVAILPYGPGWRRGSPGRVLDRGEVARLLAGCDRRRAAGRRDHAMLVLMVRLGLRANEVATLRLGDIDWRAGEILVSGKGGRYERLPLPVDVGQALADYCAHGRPRRGERALFLHARAPYGPISRTGVGEIVRRACRRAGLRPVGAHALRHTAATAMRRRGAPLGEIAQVLRHRNHSTTTVYVNVAAEELRPLAREWPGAVA